MAIQTVNIGNLENDGLGDDLRTAFQKVNASLVALDNEISVTGKNIGSGTGIFKQKTNYELELKSIKGSSNLTVTEGDNEITLSTPLQNLFATILTDNSVVVTPTDALTQLTLTGGTNCVVTGNGTTITIDVDPVGTILLSDVSLNDNDIVGTGNISINGNITANNYVGDFFGRDGLETVSAIYMFDFGTMSGVFENAVQFLISNMDFDMGTLEYPSDLEIDLGTF